MLGFQEPVQPSPTLGDALNAGYRYLEVLLGCDANHTVALHIVRRPKATPVYELERYMRCKDCSEVSVAPRPFRLSVRDLGSTVRRVIFCKGAHNGRPFGRHKTTIDTAYRSVRRRRP
ncbi:hypothetical protein ACVWXM_002178 [Bradyrhizobium sp. GM7.3]